MTKWRRRWWWSGVARPCKHTCTHTDVHTSWVTRHNKSRLRGRTNAGLFRGFSMHGQTTHSGEHSNTRAGQVCSHRPACIVKYMCVRARPLRADRSAQLATREGPKCVGVVRSGGPVLRLLLFLLHLLSPFLFSLLPPPAAASSSSYVFRHLSHTPRFN